MWEAAGSGTAGDEGNLAVETEEVVVIPDFGYCRRQAMPCLQKRNKQKKKVKS
jgi:hypothetical protein